MTHVRAARPCRGEVRRKRKLLEEQEVSSKRTKTVRRVDILKKAFKAALEPEN